VYPYGVHTNYTRKHEKGGGEPRNFLFGYHKICSSGDVT